MSRGGRRQVLQLDEPRMLYSNEPVHDHEEDDNDSAGDMPTPERLVTEDMLPPRPPVNTEARGGFEMDNKVANFLAEIDALEPGTEEEPFAATDTGRNQELPVSKDPYTPPRERSPARSKPNAYSSMFVKGTPEFVKKPDDTLNKKAAKKLEPWPDEPKSDWQQLTDEKSNYPYYWNMVTNDVVWDMPPEFSQYLLRQKEYEEKVERGLREGTLDPEQRGKPTTVPQEEKPKSKEPAVRVEEKPSRSHIRRPSQSEDSSSDSSDSDDSRSRNSRRDRRKESRKPDIDKVQPEVSSSSADSSEKLKRSASPVLPDSTRLDDKKISTSNSVRKDDSMDFDIDDIDKELEMALERKRQELMKGDDKKSDDRSEKDRHKDRKKDEHRYRDDDRRDDKHRKHGRSRDADRDRDRDGEKKGRDREDKKPKLTLKERLRIEMDIKMESEKRKKRAIEEMMARELEQTVGRGGHKRARDDRSHKRYRYDDSREDYQQSRDDYGEYSRDYGSWGDRGASSSYDDRYRPVMKPPPPTDEMIAYEEERRSQVVDYGHGRSSRHYDLNGSDSEEHRSADIREMEVKKLESLELAELALSKLEFLEVTKKGLSKLQILLIELETRHQDWQAGGLTTNHFLGKLREANWQLEQYEASAAPAGWACSWDRDYRRYFYTHKKTGKTQWDYPDADDIKTEAEKASTTKNAPANREPDSEISSTSDKGKGKSMEKDLLASMSLPPPPPPPAEEHPSVKSLQLMYGSSSDSEGEELASKKDKKSTELTNLNNVPLPPEEPRKEKEKKDKHKKKKKKEKSKKKEREKTEASVMGPVGPAYPQVPVQPMAAHLSVAPPPPPPGEEPVSLEPIASIEVPVYGSIEDGKSGLNDHPLEFGGMPEATGPHPYGEPMEGVEQAVISQGPQINPQEPDSHFHPSRDTVSVAEPSSEAMLAEASSESTSAATGHITEEKKKKKKEKMGAGSISLKKKHVSSMVQKWQKVKKEVELEEQHRQLREAEIRRKLAELE